MFGDNALFRRSRRNSELFLTGLNGFTGFWESNPVNRVDPVKERIGRDCRINRLQARPELRLGFNAIRTPPGLPEPER